MAMDAHGGMMSTSAALAYHNVGDYYPRKFGPKPDVVPSGVTERKVGPMDKPDMVAVDVINIPEPDVPNVHRKKHEHDTYVLGTIHPFRKTHRSIFGKLTQEFSLVASDRRSWRILVFGALNLLCTGCLLMWCSSTNSMALTAYTYLTIFDLFSLITCLISSWVSMKKPSQVYSFGFERLEVLAVFASTVLVQLGAMFILKESVERFMEQPEVHTGRLLVGTFVALFFNLLTLLSVRNKPFAYVSEAASSSWLQEHVADLSRSLCGIIPGLSSVLLPRMNPFVLINMAGALSLCITYMLIEINNYNAVDTASAMAIALMTFGTMYPMSVYSGKVLLQTTPSHIIGQLDKLLREVSTLDGVLEVRNEHFWTVGFGSLAGSAHVRIRRDANEQLVLAHVTNRLMPLVSTLTVQIFKDDWSRPLLSGALSSPSMPPLGHAEGYGPLPSVTPLELDPLTSTPSKPTSPPPEFSFNTPGKNAQPVLLPAPGHHLQRPYAVGLGYTGSSYTGALGQGLTRPLGSLGSLGTGPGGSVGTGFGLGASQNYRTAYGGPTAPLRFSGSAPLGSQAPYRQYRP
ncbi:LOW QUALITY PROTEIN: zinc transporter 6 [Boleophthalmus pectinirostris]|uniref:LOW QUALITY PROTEIN: zinc transporter 6 n=1 Tax=Boleophthalmus pectinirostris TaxID=150288 RepID=UPI00242F6F31|nr:LOW QUALITY PROTEIN: zinc transporter 6 [Boleophthalmus pectinirostris]